MIVFGDMRPSFWLFPPNHSYGAPETLHRVPQDKKCGAPDIARQKFGSDPAYRCFRDERIRRGKIARQADISPKSSRKIIKVTIGIGVEGQRSDKKFMPFQCLDTINRVVLVNDLVQVLIFMQDERPAGRHRVRVEEMVFLGPSEVDGVAPAQFGMEPSCAGLLRTKPQ